MSLLLSAQQDRKRLVVLGLDGLPLFLARKLGESLPNIGRLARNGTTVRAEIPELSPVNWTSFFTGKGPEKHGIFGFSQIDPDTYDLSISNHDHIQCPTIFDRLGECGLVSRVINLPTTYPAKPMRGMLVSGFVSHELDKAAYPPFLAAQLAECGYRLEADTNRGASDIDYLLKELRQTLDSRLKALDMMWPDLAWDVFIHVFTETDRLFHFFMDGVLHEDHLHHRKCMQFLADWDHAIGRYLERYDALPGAKRLLVLADHGFTEIKTEVCLNTWLKQHGYLSPGKAPANEWDASVVSRQCKAFALDPGRIYLNEEGKFGRGAATRNERASLVEQIRNGLTALTWNGERVMEQVHTREELYPGATSIQTPDLICQSRPGFDLKAKFDRTDVFGHYGRTGTHTVEGAIFCDTDGSRPASMRETGQIILDYFNIPDN